MLPRPSSTRRRMTGRRRPRCSCPTRSTRRAWPPRTARPRGSSLLDALLPADLVDGATPPIPSRRWYARGWPRSTPARASCRRPSPRSPLVRHGGGRQCARGHARPRQTARPDPEGDRLTSPCRYTPAIVELLRGAAAGAGGDAGLDDVARPGRGGSAGWGSTGCLDPTPDLRPRRGDGAAVPGRGGHGWRRISARCCPRSAGCCPEILARAAVDAAIRRQMRSGAPLFLRHPPLNDPTGPAISLPDGAGAQKAWSARPVSDRAAAAALPWRC